MHARVWGSSGSMLREWRLLFGFRGKGGGLEEWEDLRQLLADFIENAESTR